MTVSLRRSSYAAVFGGFCYKRPRFSVPFDQTIQQVGVAAAMFTNRWLSWRPRQKSQLL